MSVQNLSLEELKEKSLEVRKDVVIMVNYAASGHIGGPFSAADYLTSLWFNHLNLDPENPSWPDRDRFVLSNGHCSALLYALMARRGFFNPGYLLTFRTFKSKLLGHPSKSKLPGIEISTGSLGQGLSIAHGMAMAARLKGLDDIFVHCNCGDGELDEGQIWEAVMSAGHFKSDNLVMSVDFNGIQLDGPIDQIKKLDPLADKFRAFNWRVIETDGHDMSAIEDTWKEARQRTGKPTVVLFKTIMMNGARSFINNNKWHGNAPSDEQAIQILKELGIEKSLDELRTEYGRREFK